MKRGILKSLVCAGLLVVLCACGSNGFDVVINENIEAEYGEELDHTILYDAEKSEKDLTVKEVRDFDKMKIGEQEITVVFALGEDTQEEKVKINVKDTNAPEITFKSESVEITLGDSFDATANLESVKDPVDGDIAQSNDNTITENGYYFGGDSIASEAGEYTVTVTAFDKNGNKAEKSYKLIIKEKTQENQNQSVANNQGGSQTQAPSNNNGTVSNSGGQANNGNSGGSTTTPPKKVCPNGNEPDNPDLPCEAFVAGDIVNAYKDASGNIMAFPSSEAAYDWADAQLMNPDPNENFQKKYGYSSFATVPLWRNDNTSWNGVVFFK